MRYVERTFNIPHEYFFILKVTSQYKRASAFHVVADMLLRYPITASKQTLKRTSFHIQNFGCYENVFAFISKKLQSNFFNVIIIGKEKQTRKLIGMSENFMRKEKSKSIKIKGI